MFVYVRVHPIKEGCKNRLLINVGSKSRLQFSYVFGNYKQLPCARFGVLKTVLREGPSLLGCYASRMVDSYRVRGDTKHLRNAGDHIPVDTASHIRRRIFSVYFFNYPENCNKQGRSASDIKFLLCSNHFSL
jgi:hypothetical protein